MNFVAFCFPPGTLLRLLFIVAISALLAGFHSMIPVSDDLLPSRPSIASVNVEEVHQLGGPILWIDARSEKEYQAGHIPEALWLNEANFEVGLDSLLDRWSPENVLIVYCGSKACDDSQHLATRLKASGFTNVYVLEGGWEAWQKP